MEELFYIQNRSAGWSGNSPVWWKEGGCGYTPYLNEAQKFDKTEAERIIKSCNGTHDFLAWSVPLMERVAKRVVDQQDIASLEGQLWKMEGKLWKDF